MRALKNRMELKSLDIGSWHGALTNNSTAAASAAYGSITVPSIYCCLNAPIVGTDYYNRIGRKITCKSIDIRACLFPQPSFTAGTPNLSKPAPYSQTVRVMLVWDRCPNGSALGTSTIQDLLMETNPQGAQPTPGVVGLQGEHNMLFHNNLNNRERYLMLRDKVVQMGLGDSTSAGALWLPGSIWGPFHKFLHIRKRMSATTIFNTAAATANQWDSLGSTIQTGRLFLIVFCDTEQNTGVALQVFFTFCSRLRFYDA